MKRSVWLAAAALGAGSIGGCAFSPSFDIVSVTPAQLSPSAQNRRATRVQNVDIRTVARSGAEIAGAACEAVSSEVSVTFQTPARLRLPVFGAETAPILVTCEHRAQGRATRRIAPEAGASEGVLALLGGGLFGGEEADDPAYEREYELALARDAAPAVAPPKPSAVSSQPLPPIGGAAP